MPFDATVHGENTEFQFGGLPVPPSLPPEGRLQIGDLMEEPAIQQAYSLVALLNKHKTYGKQAGAPPYIEHLCGVANTVYEVTMQHRPDIPRDVLTDQITAALLHDTLEDQREEVTPELLAEHFNPRVRDAVLFASDLDSPDRNNTDWWQRKQHHVGRIAHAATSKEWRDRKDELVSAATICCADKLYNMRSSNRRLEFAIQNGNQSDPLLHEFWSSFKSPQMNRQAYDLVVSEAFQQLDASLEGTEHSCLTYLSQALTREVEDMSYMMTHLKEVATRPAQHQR